MQQPAAGESVIRVGRANSSFQSVHPIKPGLFSSSPRPSPPPPPQGSQPDDMGADLDSIVSSSTTTTTTSSTTASASSALATRTASLVSTVCSGTSSCACYQCRHKLPPDPPAPPAADAGLSPRHPSVDHRRTSRMLQRKKPTAHAYNKHLPRPPYAPNDSIYRAHMRPAAGTSQQEQHPAEAPSRPHPPLLHGRCTDARPHTELRWFEDTADVDLVLSFMVFDTIVADQPDDSPYGLADLIEERTRQLHDSLLDPPPPPAAAAAAAAPDAKDDPHRDDNDSRGSAASAPVSAPATACNRCHPPPQREYHTLSSRQGPPHHPLTLFHTMKLVTAAERLESYVAAFGHCMAADSGLAGWIQRRTELGPPDILCTYTPRQTAWRRPNPKRFGFLPSRLMTAKDDSTEEMMAKIASHTPMIHNPYPTATTTNTNITPPRSRTPRYQATSTSIPIAAASSNTAAPTDLLSAAYALLPNISPDILHASLNRIHHDAGMKSYDHVDTPGRPLPRAGHSRSATLDSNHSLTSNATDKTKFEDGYMRRSSSRRTFNSFGRSTLWKRTRTDTCSTHSQHTEIVTQQ